MEASYVTSCDLYANTWKSSIYWGTHMEFKAPEKRCWVNFKKSPLTHAHNNNYGPFSGGEDGGFPLLWHWWVGTSVKMFTRDIFFCYCTQFTLRPLTLCQFVVFYEMIRHIYCLWLWLFSDYLMLTRVPFKTLEQLFFFSFRISGEFDVNGSSSYAGSSKWHRTFKPETVQLTVTHQFSLNQTRSQRKWYWCQYLTLSLLLILWQWR